MAPPGHTTKKNTPIAAPMCTDMRRRAQTQTYLFRQRAFGDAIVKVEIVRPLPVAAALRGRHRHLVVGEPRKDEHGAGLDVKHPPRARRFGAGAGHRGFVVAKKLHQRRQNRRSGQGNTGNKVDNAQGQGTKKKGTEDTGRTGAWRKKGPTAASQKERVRTETKAQQRADRAHHRSTRASNRRSDRPKGPSAAARHPRLRCLRHTPRSTTTRGATPDGYNTPPAWHAAAVGR